MALLATSLPDGIMVKTFEDRMVGFCHKYHGNIWYIYPPRLPYILLYVVLNIYSLIILSYVNLFFSFSNTGLVLSSNQGADSYPV